MEMHQIRYFLAVSEELNFTRAAARCNVTQPSLTRAIMRLEDELGGPLFHRERSNTHLTELGCIVAPYLKQTYDNTLEAKSKARDFGALRKTPLKLGLMCTIAPPKLLGIIRGIRESSPGIELRITDSIPTGLIEDLLKGNLEVAICCHPEADLDERLHRVVIYKERFVVVVNSEHPLAGKQSVTTQDLEGHHYLERSNCELSAYAGQILQDHGVSEQTVYRSDRDDWILAMAAAGLGYAIMPEQCVVNSEVVTRPLLQPEIWREVCLVTVRGRPHSAAVGAVLKEARKLSKTEPLI